MSSAKRRAFRRKGADSSDEDAPAVSIKSNLALNSKSRSAAQSSSLAQRARTWESSNDDLVGSEDDKDDMVASKVGPSGGDEMVEEKAAANVQPIQRVLPSLHARPIAAAAGRKGAGFLLEGDDEDVPKVRMSANATVAMPLSRDVKPAYYNTATNYDSMPKAPAPPTRSYDGDDAPNEQPSDDALRAQAAEARRRRLGARDLLVPESNTLNKSIKIPGDISFDDSKYTKSTHDSGGDARTNGRQAALLSEEGAASLTDVLSLWNTAASDHRQRAAALSTQLQRAQCELKAATQSKVEAEDSLRKGASIFDAYAKTRDLMTSFVACARVKGPQVESFLSSTLLPSCARSSLSRAITAEAEAEVETLVNSNDTPNPELLQALMRIFGEAESNIAAAADADLEGLRTASQAVFADVSDEFQSLDSFINALCDWKRDLNRAIAYADSFAYMSIAEICTPWIRHQSWVWAWRGAHGVSAEPLESLPWISAMWPLGELEIQAADPSRVREANEADASLIPRCLAAHVVPILVDLVSRSLNLQSSDACIALLALVMELEAFDVVPVAIQEIGKAVLRAAEASLDSIVNDASAHSPLMGAAMVWCTLGGISSFARILPPADTVQMISILVSNTLSAIAGQLRMHPERQTKACVRCCVGVFAMAMDLLCKIGESPDRYPDIVAGVARIRALASEVGTAVPETLLCIAI